MIHASAQSLASRKDFAVTYFNIWVSLRSVVILFWVHRDMFPDLDPTHLLFLLGRRHAAFRVGSNPSGPLVLTRPPCSSIAAATIRSWAGRAGPGGAERAGPGSCLETGSAVLDGLVTQAQHGPYGYRPCSCRAACH